MIPLIGIRPRTEKGLARRLRAWWSFDENFGNHSRLGARLNARAVNGASRRDTGGIRGGALHLTREKTQYLRVPRSALDDNSAGHTVSLWARPSSLPEHGSGDRHFLIESLRGGETANAAGYSISIGLRSCDDPDKINLQLYTRTLKPAESIAAAPTEISQGGFDFLVDRSAFRNHWVHVACTFDSRSLGLHLDGREVARHPLPVPGAIAETGGLIIGGHREGIGRNFDGLLDEIGIWQRVLTPEELARIHGDGTPPRFRTVEDR